MSVYKDMLKFYRLYNCWSNYYREADLWNKPLDEKIEMASKQGKLFKMRDEFIQYKYAERAFLSKYSAMKYESSPRLIRKRAEAYFERYHIPYDIDAREGFYQSDLCREGVCAKCTTFDDSCQAAGRRSIP